MWSMKSFIWVAELIIYVVVRNAPAMSGVAPPSSGRSRELRSATRKDSIHSSVSSLGAEDSFIMLKSPRAGLASLGHTNDQAFSTVRAAAAAQHAGVGGGFITLLEELMELSDVRRLERRQGWLVKEGYGHDHHAHILPSQAMMRSHVAIMP
ncbi:hypothetical protein FOZ61_006562 [Perkinsus olseni]|uniref:Uncharacterized protein n=1 Tax=Perkinsus olseni TaxID=32597 RepID=A0A7J6LCH5_PEROL|nr:hypothetical protein FOZ61_006562 [Perkinsus olseni]